MRNLVSIIIPIYNREKLIVKTLKELKKQIYRPLQIILVNDCSTDNTLKKINSFKKINHKKNFQILIFSNKKNFGACFSRNLGIQKARGKYIQFLDSDDFLHKDKINIQVKMLKHCKRSSLAISDFQWLKDNKVIKSSKNNGDLFKRVALGWSIYTSSPLIKTSLIKNNLYWNEKLDFLQDKDFLFKVLMLAGNYIYVPGFTSYYIRHKFDQISNQYSSKKPQFFLLIHSRLFFLVERMFQINSKHLSYAILSIFYLYYEFFLYHLKRFIKFVFGESIFQILKKFYNYRK